MTPWHQSTTAEPTLYLTLYRERPLLPWPAHTTVQVIETIPFVGGLSALNAYMCVGWTTERPAMKAKP